MSGQVHGHCDPKFAEVREEFERNFAERGEKGASVCLSVGGETLVDLWGGVADVKTGDEWREDTVSIVFSCTKAATAICAHILIDRGELELQAPVSKYWPEFAKAGKEKTTVQMMLNHESAIPALREPVKEKGFLDWDYMIKRMEDEPAWWEPGTRNGYHMVNFGWTVGELVRRVSGKSLGQFFADEVAGPTGAKFWIGLPDGVEPHMADILPYIPQKGDPVSDFAGLLMGDPTSIQALSFLNNGGWGANDKDAHKAEIGGAGGISNARGQVAMYTPLAMNDGSLVSRDRVAAMSMVSTATQRDATLLVPTRFASGFMKSMDNRALPGAQAQSAIIGKEAFGHVGAGGHIGFADPECGLAFSYTMSQMGLGLLMNERGQSLIDAAYRALGYRSNAPGAWVK
ncbi:serine hydrolase domain-containing protein [Henriciella sp.]|uniref:serine hydrolase domain-containing protein n=1 Tax=Henriciella sp. TaxID=1968823 RepID=UPI0017BF9D50|nr:serine hydrolase domain-containing protein [Henriciella sp.]HIG21280.1 class A beta-lactamase-related serine hydrolase [Henriciella sp.]